MNVVHINSERHWGGGEVQTYYLIKGLRDKGIKNTLVAQPNSPLAVNASKDGITIKEIPMKGEWDIIAILKIRQLLRRIQPDILHLHTAHAHTIGLVAGRLAKVKKILVTRRMDFPIEGFISRLRYNKTDKIVAISQAVKGVLIESGIHEDKITVIHSTIDRNFSPLKSNLREELDLAVDTPLLGTAARLVERKGHCYLFEALAKASKRFPHAKLLVAGEGPLEERLKNLAKTLGLENQIIFLGFRHDIAEILSALDMFVLASVKEGLGVSLLEAGSYGVPIVATNVGGIPEIVQDGVTGFLVPPRDSEALAEKIIHVLDHPQEARKMGENAREKIKNHFSVQDMAKSYTRLYQSMNNEE